MVDQLFSVIRNDKKVRKNTNAPKISIFQIPVSIPKWVIFQYSGIRFGHPTIRDVQLISQRAEISKISLRKSRSENIFCKSHFGSEKKYSHFKISLRQLRWEIFQFLISKNFWSLEKLFFLWISLGLIFLQQMSLGQILLFWDTYHWKYAMNFFVINLKSDRSEYRNQ